MNSLPSPLRLAVCLQVFPLLLALTGQAQTADAASPTAQPPAKPAAAAASAFRSFLVDECVTERSIMSTNQCAEKLNE